MPWFSNIIELLAKIPAMYRTWDADAPADPNDAAAGLGAYVPPDT